MHRPVRHVVWDWNGTLFDDVPLLVASANAALAAVGGDAITIDDYRRHFGRPIHVFYEKMLGRPIADGEWPLIDDAFHDHYDELAVDAELTVDAEAAIERVASLGLTQSVLSMWRHERLEPRVRELGIESSFVRVDGLRGEGGGHKAPYLATHVETLATLVGLAGPSDVLMIGDTIDDAHACELVGVGCVLYGGGEHPVERLERTGFDVSTSLLDALERAGVG